MTPRDTAPTRTPQHRPEDSRRPFVPWRTLLLAGAVLGLAASPDWTAALTTERGNWDRLWPLLTGHLCHWTAGHLFWDLLVFAIVGPPVERRLGRAFFPWLALAGVGIIATVFALMPEIASYRGLSGIDSFLYTFLALKLGSEMYPEIRCKLRPWVFLPLVLLAAKTVFEVNTGATLFAGSLGEGVVPLPLAHLAGALFGLLAFAVRTR